MLSMAHKKPSISPELTFAALVKVLNLNQALLLLAVGAVAV
jgi:hypothetical protein